MSPFKHKYTARDQIFEKRLQQEKSKKANRKRIRGNKHQEYTNVKLPSVNNMKNEQHTI